MERETKTIETPGKHTVEVKTYLTYGEWREIQGVFLQGIKVGVNETGDTNIDDINASLAFEAQNKLIELLVVSVDGKKEKVLDAVMGMSREDGEFIVREIEKVQNEFSAEKKSK